MIVVQVVIPANVSLSGAPRHHVANTHKLGAGERLLRPAVLDAHAIHIICQALPIVKLPKANTAVFILGRKLFPLLHSRDTSLADSLEWIGDRLHGSRILNIDKGNRDQARASQSSDRFRNKPFRIRLSHHNDGFSGFGLQFIGPFGIEIILDNAVHHGAVMPTSQTLASRVHDRPCRRGRLGSCVA